MRHVTAHAAQTTVRLRRMCMMGSGATNNMCRGLILSGGILVVYPIAHLLPLVWVAPQGPVWQQHLVIALMAGACASSTSCQQSASALHTVTNGYVLCQGCLLPPKNVRV